MATPAATVAIDFAAETAKFTAELKKVNGRLKSLEGGFESVTRIAKGFLAGVSVSAIGNFITTTAAAADELGKTADRLGESTESLKGFQIAAADAGVEVGSANKILAESQKRLAEASTGSGEAAKFIKLLGLNINELRTQSPVELFETYSDAIAQLSTKGEQAAAASALMGKAAAEAMSFIAKGGEGIRESTEFVTRYGLALDSVDTKKISLAADSIARLQQYSEAAGQRIAAGLSPFITALADDLLGAADNTTVLQERAEQFGAVAYAAFQVVANSGRVLQAAFYGIAAAGARMLQAVTFGNVSRAFEASVTENLAAANNALMQVKSFAQIGAEITALLEKSRADAVAAAQANQDAHSKTGTLTLLPDPVVTFNLATQYAEMMAQIGAGAAEAQMQVEQEITDHLLRQLEEREQYRRAFSSGQNAFATAEEKREAEAQKAITDSRDAALGAGLNALQTYAAQSKTAAKALVLIEKGQAIASAIMNTYVGATKQLTSGDPYTATARAAMVIAFGLAQVAAIAKQGYGQMSQISASPSAGAPIGSPQNPVYTQPQSSGTDERDSGQSVLQVNIHGNFFGNRETVNYLIDQFREEINNRDVVLFSPTSRQAQELAPPE